MNKPLLISSAIRSSFFLARSLSYLPPQSFAQSVCTPTVQVLATTTASVVHTFCSNSRVTASIVNFKFTLMPSSTPTDPNAYHLGCDSSTPYTCDAINSTDTNNVGFVNLRCLQP